MKKRTIKIKKINSKLNKKNKTLLFGVALLIILAVVFAPKLLDLTGRAGLASGLVAYYKMESNANDETTNDLDGTTVGVDCESYIPGKVDSGCKFESLHGDHISLGNPPELLIVGDLTLTTWVNLAEMKNQNIISRGSMDAYYDEERKNNWLYSFSIGVDGKLSIFWESGAGGNVMCVSDDKVERLGKWVHVAVVRNAETTSSVNFYINGTSAGSCIGKANPTGGIGGRNQIVCIGANCRGSDKKYFNGKMDELRVYNKVLASSDIKAIYDEEYTGVPTTAVTTGECTTRMSNSPECTTDPLKPHCVIPTIGEPGICVECYTGNPHCTDLDPSKPLCNRFDYICVSCLPEGAMCFGNDDHCCSNECDVSSKCTAPTGAAAPVCSDHDGDQTACEAAGCEYVLDLCEEAVFHLTGTTCPTEVSSGEQYDVDDDMTTTDDRYYCDTNAKLQPIIFVDDACAHNYECIDQICSVITDECLEYCDLLQTLCNLMDPGHALCTAANIAACA